MRGLPVSGNLWEKEMEYDTLRFEEDGRVAVITLLVPVGNCDERNQLSFELSECCTRFRGNPEARVLVVTGDTAEVFSMGEVLMDAAKEREGRFSITEPIATLQRPVLMGITGDAIGQGLEMALACDVRIAAEGARFSMPHVGMGMIPRDGGTQRLSRTVGKAKALEMILTGEPVEASEALRIGLVSGLVPADEVVTHVIKMAHEMATKSPISLDYCKEAIIKGMDLTLEQGIRMESDLYFLIHTTRDREEGIRAFQEKRKPDFKGI